ncbi:MAG: NUDIX hydrolase [Clostridia bacterium]|nr:NUDIX hydrolase [Clostridia bacterium]
MHEQLNTDQVYVTVDILILAVREGRLQVLLSRRPSPPYAGLWALPGRFVGLSESTEATARSLLQEMLPLRGAYVEQLYTFSDVSRDPRGRVISVSYLVLLSPQQLQSALAAGSGRLRSFAASCAGLSLALDGGDGVILGEGDLAFDHGRIIRTGILRLRGKIDYTDVGFHFLADQQAFALSELQDVFEAVLGKPTDTSNFRRAVLARYEATGRIEQTEKAEKRRRGRPAALYRVIPRDE